MKEDKKLDKNVGTSVYQAVMSARCSAYALFWQRYNIMALINLGFVTAILARYTKNDEGASILEIPVQSAWIGYVLAFIWLAKIRIGKFWMAEIWDKRVLDHEQYCLSDYGLKDNLMPIKRTQKDIEGGGKEGERNNFVKKRISRNIWNFSFCAIALPLLCGSWWTYALCVKLGTDFNLSGSTLAHFLLIIVFWILATLISWSVIVTRTDGDSHPDPK